MGEGAHLAFMPSGGGQATVLADGNFNSISMTNGYVYFKDYWNESLLYHTIPGSTYYGTVDAAKQAAMDNIKEENEKAKEE